MNEIEKMRKEKEWSRRELSYRSGISEHTIYKIERDGYKAKVEVIVRLANALGLTFQDVKSLVKGMDIKNDNVSNAI